MIKKILVGRKLQMNSTLKMKEIILLLGIVKIVEKNILTN